MKTKVLSPGGVVVKSQRGQEDRGSGDRDESSHVIIVSRQRVLKPSRGGYREKGPVSPTQPKKTLLCPEVADFHDASMMSQGSAVTYLNVI